MIVFLKTGTKQNQCNYLYFNGFLIISLYVKLKKRDISDLINKKKKKTVKYINLILLQTVQTSEWK